MTFSPDPAISGTLDRQTGLFRFTAQWLDDTGDAGPDQEFVGMYSNTEPPDGGAPDDPDNPQPHYARLVFFPVDAGPQLIVHVQLPTP